MQGLGGPSRPWWGGQQPAQAPEHGPEVDHHDGHAAQAPVAAVGLLDLSPAGVRARFADVQDPAHPLALAVHDGPEPVVQRISELLAGPDGAVAAYHLLATLALCTDVDPSLLSAVGPDDLFPPRWPSGRDALVLDPSPAGLRHWFVDLLPEVLPTGSRLPAVVAGVTPEVMQTLSDRLLHPVEDPQGHRPEPDLPLAVHSLAVRFAADALELDLPGMPGMREPAGQPGLDGATGDLAGLTPRGCRPEQWLERDELGRWTLPPEHDEEIPTDGLVPSDLADQATLEGVVFGPVHGFSRWRLARRGLAGLAVLAVAGAGLAVALPSSRGALRDSGPVVAALGSRYIAFDGTLSTARPAPHRSYDLVMPPGPPPGDEEIVRMLGATTLAGSYSQAPLDDGPARPRDAWVTVRPEEESLRVLAVSGRPHRLSETTGMRTSEALARTRAMLRAFGVDPSQVHVTAADLGDGTTRWVRVVPAVDLPDGDFASNALGGTLQFDAVGPTDVSLHIALLRPRPPAALDSAAQTWKGFEQHLSPYDLPRSPVHYDGARLVYSSVLVDDPSGGLVERLAPAWEFSHPSPYATKELPGPPVTVAVAADPAERSDTITPR